MEAFKMRSKGPRGRESPSLRIVNGGVNQVWIERYAFHFFRVGRRIAFCVWGLPNSLIRTVKRTLLKRTCTPLLRQTVICRTHRSGSRHTEVRWKSCEQIACAQHPHSQHRFPAPFSLEEGRRKPVLGVLHKPSHLWRVRHALGSR